MAAYKACAPYFVTGGVFGAALTVSGVFVPSVILEQFELDNFYMLHVFGTAIGIGA